MVYTLEVYALRVYSLRPPILDLDMYTLRVYILDGYTLWVYSLGPPILDLSSYLPVLKKQYRGPFNVNVVQGNILIILIMVMIITWELIIIIMIMIIMTKTIISIITITTMMMTMMIMTIMMTMMMTMMIMTMMTTVHAYQLFVNFCNSNTFHKVCLTHPTHTYALRAPWYSVLCSTTATRGCKRHSCTSTSCAQASYTSRESSHISYINYFL